MHTLFHSLTYIYICACRYINVAWYYGVRDPITLSAVGRLKQAAERAGLVAEVECAQEASAGRVWSYILHSIGQSIHT